MTDTPANRAQTLATAYFDAVAKYVVLSSKLTALAAKITELEELTLPEAFDAAGMAGNNDLMIHGVAIRFTRGTFVFGAMPNEEKEPEKHEAAVNYAMELGLQDLLQSKVVAAWGRGEREKAVAFYNATRADNSASVKLSENIHHSTLQAEVRRRLKVGEEIDPEKLGCTVKSMVRLKTDPRKARRSNNGDNNAE